MMDRISQSTYNRADEGLKRLIDKARVAALSEEEVAYYEASMKALEDEMNMKEVGFEEGFEEGKKAGIEEGKKFGIEEGEHNKSRQIAIQMKKKGYDFLDISELTTLSIEEIEKL